MCHSTGSIDQACPMCKVIQHTSRCPHVKDVCRNRAAHPRMDVLYLTNAEVDCFNGCGFCKWTNADPSRAQTGYNNPGWPGCCRPPLPNEYDKIELQDWRAVSIVHGVPIPAHLELIIKSLPLPSKTNNAQSVSPTRRNSSSKPSTPSSARKTTGNISPSSNKSSVVSTKALNTPSTQSRGKSPHESVSGANLSRTPSMSGISSSVPTSPSTMDTIRRKPVQSSDRIHEDTHSSNSSPSRKSIDLESSTPKRRGSTVRRPTLTPATTSVSLSKIVASDSRRNSDAQMSAAKRRPSLSSAAAQLLPTSPTPRTPEKTPFIISKVSKNDDDRSVSSGSGSSDGPGSLSDHTVTSDGGFTDYLSDESEAELQRQAEEKALVIAQLVQEENDFRLARQQLANITLRPPKMWNPTGVISTSIHG